MKANTMYTLVSVEYSYGCLSYPRMTGLITAEQAKKQMKYELDQEVSDQVAGLEPGEVEDMKRDGRLEYSIEADHASISTEGYERKWTIQAVQVIR